MPDYVYRQVTSTRHEWRVPNAGFGSYGAAIAEVHKAMCAAEERYREIYDEAPRHDDWLRVWAADDEIVLWFTEEAGR